MGFDDLNEKKYKRFIEKIEATKQKIRDREAELKPAIDDFQIDSIKQSIEANYFLLSTYERQLAKHIKHYGTPKKQEPKKKLDLNSRCIDLLKKLVTEIIRARS